MLCNDCNCDQLASNGKSYIYKQKKSQCVHFFVLLFVQCDWFSIVCLSHGFVSPNQKNNRKLSKFKFTIVSILLYGYRVFSILLKVDVESPITCISRVNPNYCLLIRIVFRRNINTTGRNATNYYFGYFSGENERQW